MDHALHCQDIIRLFDAAATNTTPELARARRGLCWDITIKISLPLPDMPGAVSQGSGVLLSSHGLLLTNYHVLPRDAGTATISLQRGPDEVYCCNLEKMLCVNERLDLALGACRLPERIQRSLSDYEPIVTLGVEPRVGDRVRVYGFKHEVTEERPGKIIGRHEPNLHHSFRAEIHADKMGLHAWYSDACVEHGFSGGPVIREATGELIGFTSWMSQYPDGRRLHGFVDAGAVSSLLRAYVAAKIGAPQIARSGALPKKQGLFQMLRERFSRLRRKV